MATHNLARAIVAQSRLLTRALRSATRLLRDAELVGLSPLARPRRYRRRVMVSALRKAAQTTKAPRRRVRRRAKTHLKRARDEGGK